MKRTLRNIFSGLFPFFGPAVASADDTPDLREQQTQCNPLDVFQLEYAGDPRLSPDGERIVCVRSSMDVMKDRKRSSLWSIRVNCSEHRSLTGGDGEDSQARWSVDGRRLAYVRRTTIRSSFTLSGWTPGRRRG